MKMRSLLASAAACAVALSAMALSASAANVEYTEKITLDATEATAEKMWQYELTNLDGNGTLTQIVLDVTTPFAATGWSGGGGAIGMNFGESWYQADFAPEAVADGEIGPDNWTATIDIPETYDDQAQDFTDGIIQIGWWWGAGDTIEINKITFVFEGGSTETPTGDDSSSDDTSSGDTSSDNTSNDNAGNTDAAAPSAGDAGVALAVAGLAVAGAAAFVARKRG